MLQKHSCVVVDQGTKTFGREEALPCLFCKERASSACKPVRLQWPDGTTSFRGRLYVHMAVALLNLKPCSQQPHTIRAFRVNACPWTSLCLSTNYRLTEAQMCVCIRSNKDSEIVDVMCVSTSAVLLSHIGLCLWQVSARLWEAHRTVPLTSQC